MNAVVDQKDFAINRLVRMVDTENPFNVSHKNLLPMQLSAINERFKARVNDIKLLAHRAEGGGIAEVSQMKDIVPLLFAHTAYKSYPESWLIEQKWDRLGKWLDTVSTNRVQAMETTDIKSLDGWLQRLEESGHFVSCSRGTSGKCAMMNATQVDLDFSGHSLLQGMIWAGLAPNHDRLMIGLGQVASTPRNRATGTPMAHAFSPLGVAPITPNVSPITIGGITEMVALRKKMAEGTAKPSEIAYVEAQTEEREKAIESAVAQAANSLIENRRERLHIMGLFGPLFKVAELVRAKGYSGKDFQENTSFISGGLKRAQLPPNYREFVFETFNLSPERVCQAYGMQELNSTAIRCRAGRYHMAPWVMLLLLDESGEKLIDPTDTGELEGRAGFFDLSLDGRWGGVISGDKIRATWARCACGNHSPSVNMEIQRYADMAGGDKIACAGTIDAYVRGVS
jgi:hypothetical protein